jgi:hypothetical protein
MMDERDSIQRLAALLDAEPVAVLLMAVLVIAGIALIVWVVDRYHHAADERPE